MTADRLLTLCPIATRYLNCKFASYCAPYLFVYKQLGDVDLSRGCLCSEGLKQSHMTWSRWAEPERTRASEGDVEQLSSKVEGARVRRRHADDAPSPRVGLCVVVPYGGLEILWAAGFASTSFASRSLPLTSLVSPIQRTILEHRQLEVATTSPIRSSLNPISQSISSPIPALTQHGRLGIESRAESTCSSSRRERKHQE